MISSNNYNQVIKPGCLQVNKIMLINIYFTLVLVDLHGVLHLRQRFHVGVVGLPLFLVIFVLIELLQRQKEDIIKDKTKTNIRD